MQKDELPEEYRLLCMDLEPKYDSLIVRVVNSTSVSMDKERLDKFHGCPYVLGIDIFQWIIYQGMKKRENYILKLLE